MYGEWTEEWGRQATDGLLRAAPDLDAIFCGNDQIARGVADAVREAGKRVPEDIALVGFDNWEVIAAANRPPLTTVDMNLRELGRTAGEELLSAIEGRPSSGLRRLPCSLVLRESSRPRQTPGPARRRVRSRDGTGAGNPARSDHDGPVPALTETEAAARAALIDVASYDVFADLTAEPGPVPDRDPVQLRRAGGGHVRRADGDRAMSAVLNGRELGPPADGRLALPGLAAENTLVVEAEVDGDALSRFTDPADGAGYLLFTGYPTQAPRPVLLLRPGPT